MPGDPRASKVFARDPASYGPGDAERAFGQYQMYVGDIGRLERLRGYANAFYLSANTGLTAALAALASLATLGDPGMLWLIAGGVAGLVLGYWWRRVIKSYASLARAKWRIATKVEKTMPLRLYQTEWKSLKVGSKGASYAELTEVEKRIPVVFMSIYSLFIAYVACTQIHSLCMRLAGGA